MYFFVVRVKIIENNKRFFSEIVIILSNKKINFVNKLGYLNLSLETGDYFIPL